MKRKLKIIIALGLLGLSMPLLNLVVTPNNEGALPKRGADFPHWDEAMAVLSEKCVHCHTADAELPWYSALPVVSTLLDKDIELGRNGSDFKKELYRDIPGFEFSAAALAKLEYVLAEDSMPPIQYLAMHWNHGLTAQDKLTLSKWISATREKFFKVEGVASEFATHPLQPLAPAPKLDPAKVALGDALYHDVRLSGDNTLSCASCHDLAKGGTDQAKTSTGIRGQMGPINAPTVYNSGVQFLQFWDGRAKDLQDQAGGPVANPIEMGAQWPDVIAKLKADPATHAKLVALYGEGYEAEHVQDAIAAFEATLVTPSRFDKFMRGDKEALSKQEKEGFKLFTEKGCARCHVGQALGGQSFEKMGLEEDYFAGREVADVDLGRYNVTKDEHDKHRFKVPILRNIAVTFPYFHDGSTSDLKEAVQIMARHQLEDELSEAEADAVVAFLKSLTGEFRGQQLK